MRINGTNATNVVSTPSATRRTNSAGGFSVPNEESQSANTQPAALRTVGGIDALIALQSDAEPGEKRKRAVRRGSVALDALDELKHALLAGTLSSSTLQRLKSAATDLKGVSGEPRLDAVLAEIELRIEVEIAKHAPR